MKVELHEDQGEERLHGRDDAVVVEVVGAEHGEAEEHEGEEDDGEEEQEVDKRPQRQPANNQSIMSVCCDFRPNKGDFFPKGSALRIDSVKFAGLNEQASAMYNARGKSALASSATTHEGRLVGWFSVLCAQES